MKILLIAGVIVLVLGLAFVGLCVALFVSAWKGLR